MHKYCIYINTLVSFLLSSSSIISFGFERTWWRLFQKRVLRTKLDIYFFITLILMTMFFSLFFLEWVGDCCLNIWASSVPEEGYFRNGSCALNLISTFLLRWYWWLFVFFSLFFKWVGDCCLNIWASSVTWRRLFQKRVLCTKFDIYVFNYCLTPSVQYFSNINNLFFSTKNDVDVHLVPN